MKIVISILLLLLYFSNKSFSQDTLLLNDGKEIYVKVIEIDNSQIRYKKKENLSGPIYSIEISKVFMIFYANGSRETIQANNSSDDKIDNTNQSNSPVSGEEDNTITVAQEGWQLILESFSEDLAMLKKHGKALKVTFYTKAINYKTGKITVNKNGKYFTSLEFGFISNKKPGNGKNAVKNNHAYFYIPDGNPLSGFLYKKYESILGKGGLYFTKDFLNTNTTCSILQLYEFSENSNNKITAKANKNGGLYTLNDCSTEKKKVLSIALTWLNINFNNKEPDKPGAITF